MAPDEIAEYGDDEGDLLHKLAEWGTLHDAHWGKWQDESRESYDFVALRQWSADVVADMEANERTPITIDRMGTTIDAVVGAEIVNRQQVTYEPRQVGDTAVNEVLTGTADWVRDECDAEHEESEAFRDMLICGMGWTETRHDEEVRADGQIIIDRIDPLEMTVDPSSYKTNCADARHIRRSHRMSREEFDERFPDEIPAADGENATNDGSKRVTIVDPATRYEHGMLGGDDDAKDEVIVREWQWFDRQAVIVVQHPETGETVEVGEGDYYDALDNGAPDLGGQRRIKRVYYRAFVGAGRVLRHEEIEAGAFTYCAMTGKRDRNDGVWYGLVRPMKDPQRLSNKFFSQIKNILDKNAKGGIMAEADAFEDPKEAERSWASSEEITWLREGGLTKVQPKPQTPYPSGFERMMEIANTGVRDSTGVNLELLGMAEREQPGVLEHQRKQAAYGILATFFDAARRYRKIQGRVLLKFIQLYVPQGTMIRLTGENGVAQYVPSAYLPDTIEFNVIVDDAPAGPNQKQQAFQVITQIIPLLQQAELPPEIWAELVRYSPLHTALAEKLAGALVAKSQAPPSPESQLALAAGQAKVEDIQAGARQKNANAQKTAVEAALLPHQQHFDNAAKNEELTHAQMLARSKAVQAILQAQAPGPAELH